MKKHILLIYTGGTIGMVKDYKSKSLRPFDFENILKHIPELKLIDAELSVKSFEKVIDSSEMNAEHWQNLAKIVVDNYNEYDGFVILNGTDTMAYTASALSFMLYGLQKPIIFTGSQLPIGDLRTDAKENLISSIHFATLSNGNAAVIREVCVYFEYKLYRANRTTKWNAHHFDAFRSPNFPVLGESGVHVEVFGEYLYRDQHPQMGCDLNLSKNVGLLKIFPNMSDDFLYSILRVESLEALIIETYGSGNIFTRPHFSEMLKERAADGLKVIAISQCLGGGVELGLYETSVTLLNSKAISGKDLTTEAAVTKTMYLLGNKDKYSDFNKSFIENLRGEIKENQNIFS